MKYLVFHNPGVSVPRNLFLVYGASTKTQDTTKVGKFGSGTKLAAIALTRKGIPPTILGYDTQGPYRIEYRVRSGADLELSQDVIEVYVNNIPSGVLGTVDAARNWDKPIPGDDNWAYKAVRELIQNHLVDETEGYHVIQEAYPNPEAGATTLLPLDSTGEIERLAEHLDKYLLEGTPVHTWVMGKETVRAYRCNRDNAHLYVSGMLVSQVSKSGKFDVDLWPAKDSTLLDEERLISDLWTYQHAIALGLKHMANVDMIRDLLDSINNHGSEEDLFKATEYDAVDLTEKELKLWAAGFRMLFPPGQCKGTLLSGKDFHAELRARELGYRVVGTELPGAIKKILLAAGIQTPEDLIPKTDRIQWVSLPPKHQELLQEAVAIVEAHIPDITKYEVRTFCLEEHQDEVLGLAVDKIIGLSTQIFKGTNQEVLEVAVATLVHERDHLVTGAGDGSSRFRDEADQNLAKLMISSKQVCISCEVVPFRNHFRIQLPDSLCLPSVTSAEWYSSRDALMVHILGYGSLVATITLPEGRASGTISYNSKGKKFLGIPSKFLGDVWKSTRIIRFRRIV